MENRPDIELKTNKIKNMHADRCGDRWTETIHEGKQNKYKSLCTEIQQMCYMKCNIIPVTTGANKIVTEVLKKNLEALLRKHSIDSLQKTAVLGTAHIIWKALQCEA